MSRRLGHSNYDGKIAGLYDLEETLGRGHFAVVKLARHVFTGEKVAVKVIDKSKLDEVSRSHLFQEVRCMKLVQHPNVVRLYEVIDTQTKLYLILELGDGGDLYDYIMRHDSGLTEEVAKNYFRQIVRAISYCHRLHVVHRDLKPENVVFFEKLGTVKLTDFGFSNRFCPGQKLETSCGSLAYSAPEILLGDSYDAPAVDVWSLGVILYMLVCGQAPFQEANDSETLTMIMDCKYSIPAHVSDECKKLIAKMLVRKPEGRSTLEEIASDSWLGIANDCDIVESLPLVSRQQVSEDNHNFIITKMVNGNIATKEEILEALDKNEYNHITATYFLLAERKLRACRQELAAKNCPELLNVRSNDLTVNNLRVEQNSSGSVKQSLLTVPRIPIDTPQNVRVRKCSIVQEEEDEDDVSSCSGHDEHNNNASLCLLNRRGSRSEGKLSHILQEHLAQLPEKTLIKPVLNNNDHKKIIDKCLSPSHTFTVVRVNTDIGKMPDEENLKNSLSGNDIWSSSWNKSIINETEQQPLPTNKWNNIKAEKSPIKITTTTPTTSPSKKIENYKNIDNDTTMKILLESSTVPIRSSITVVESLKNYKTMPIKNINNTDTDNLLLKEILEDNNCEINKLKDNFTKCRVVRRPGYEQKRNKFHKARAASCSSSDASDDDSESRKKHAHRLGATTEKPLPVRRDSHDDSSDSQDPSGNCEGSGNLGSNTDNDNKTRDTVNQSSTNTTNTSTTTTTTSSGGKVQRCNDAQTISSFSKRHRIGRRRNGETRLRESQSLNRITEVQEAEIITSKIKTNNDSSIAESHDIIDGSSPKIISQKTLQTTEQRAKGFGARLLQTWNLIKTSGEQDTITNENKKKYSINEQNKNKEIYNIDKENTRGININKNECKSRKIELLSQYFAVHKKLCVPLPSFLSKGKLYKPRSCDNVSKEQKSSGLPKSMQLYSSNDKQNNNNNNNHYYHQHHRGSDGNINQNIGLNKCFVDAKRCNELSSICHIHLGDVSKCSSRC
ncbi:SNF-related serine/threonine-protein kinase isoform X2 [Aphidius gifuensis]|uniref:SNF-related serine/threonine-protein kinase isoform X2 n=1 Tax=Aphidius gifuensis TaxID=684658 RepID=UPI001CDC34B4|nr:SNF-related serine/threonine-protein kinase isoform X2 [Aphidius gifuensis]